MVIAMGAIGPLLPKLGELLSGELAMEKQVRKGIKSLVTELTLMHAALRKVAKVPADQLDEGVKIWAGNVKELSYQMEDIVDAFMVRVEDGGEHANPKNRVKKILKKVKMLFKNGKHLHRISDALEEAVHQAKQLAELRQRYEHEMRDTGVGASVDPRMMALYTDETELVGIEETRDKLIDMLTEGDDWKKHPLMTISIVGFGGLGKTTLAKAAYDKLKVQFDCCAFVSVSQNPEMKKVLKDILYGLDKFEYENIHNAARDEKHLIDDIIEYLNDKRYLIVIDDIWSGKAWELIQCAFSKNSPGSRLMTTTRNVSVSEACCSSWDDIYRMEPLSDDVSRTLFCKRVFSHKEGCPQELLQVSKDILKKCGGIPLAIITIASLLANKHQIKRKDQWYALLSSIGHGLTEDRSLEQMKNILLLSYYDLPWYLKPCLLYLSIFPEDHKIKKSRLIWRWISEGFVYSEKQETSLYELGDSYFNELVNRSMIQPIGEDKENVEACRVHDMVLDLICSLSSEENFVTILDGTGRRRPNSESKVRRLSIQNCKIDVDTSRMEHVRSVTICTHNVAGKVLDISCFRVLRVLDLEGCDISDIGYVDNLIHLRYLGLKGTHVVELPVEIGKLQFLITLDIRGTEIKVLPSSVAQLKRLMCLHVNRFMKLPSGIGNLTSLEVLTGLGEFDEDLDIVKGLGHLTKLRVLSIDYSGSDECVGKALEESLGNLCKLEILDICCGSDARNNFMSEGWVPPPRLRRLSMPNGSWFSTVPSWINPTSLSLLSYLDIHVEEVRPEHIRVLRTMPALCFLKLGGDVDRRLNIRAVLSSSSVMVLKLEWGPPDPRQYEDDPSPASSAADNPALAVLEAFQPYRYLLELRITRYPGASLMKTRCPGEISPCSTWLSGLEKLTRLYLKNCRKLKDLPALGGLQCLELLDIKEMNSVERIDTGLCGKGGLFPNLKKIVLDDMPKLEAWHDMPESAFPLLREVSINYCPQLSSLSGLGSCRGPIDLRIQGCALITPGSLPANFNGAGKSTCICKFY